MKIQLSRSLTAIFFSTMLIYPVLDAHVFKLSFPLITVSFYFVFILFNVKRIKMHLVEIALSVLYLISIIYNIIAFGWIPIYSEAIFLVFVSPLVAAIIFHDKETSDLSIKYYLYVYFFLVFMINIYRLLFIHHMDIYRVRNGVGIYSSYFPFLFYLLISIENKKKFMVIIAYVFGIIIAMFFSRRGAIITHAIVGIYLFLNPHILAVRHKIWMGGFLCIALFLGDKMGYLDLIAWRMRGHINNVLEGGAYLGTRQALTEEAINYLISGFDAFIFGCGLGRYKESISEYTNCHNFILDVWTTAGLFCMMIVLFVFFKTIIRIGNRAMYCVLVLYGIFQGECLFYVRDITMWSLNYYLILYTYYMVNKKCVIRYKT